MLLFPVTLFYFSPVIPIEGAFESIINGSLFVFAALLVSGIFFGRLFCAYLCPGGGLQECAFLVQSKAPKKGRRYYIKYIVCIAMIAATVIVHVLNGQPVEVDFFYLTMYGVSVSSIDYYVVYYGIILLILLPAFIAGKRAFCHYICWMAPLMITGRKIGRLFGLPGIYILYSKEKCTMCKRCASVCPMSLGLDEITINGAITRPECIQCGSCVDSCPQKSLSYKMGRGR